MTPPPLPAGPCPICLRACPPPDHQIGTWRVGDTHTFLVYACAACGPVRVNPLDPRLAYLSRSGAAPVTLDQVPAAVQALTEAEWP